MWKINKAVLALCRLGMITIVPSMTIIVFVQVILRYGFHNSLSWVEELARYMLVWVTSLGSVYASQKGMHVSVEALRSRLSGSAQVVVVLAIHLAVLFFFAIGAWQGGIYAAGGWTQHSASLDMRMFYVYAAIPAAFGLMVLTQAERFVVEIKQALSDPACRRPQAKAADMSPIDHSGGRS